MFDDQNYQVINLMKLPADLIMQKVLIYNRSWDMRQDVDYHFQIADEFEFTTDRQLFNSAKAVIFHMPTLKEEDFFKVRTSKKEDQLWIFWSTECELHYNWQRKSDVISLFDIKASYKFTSDIPIPYVLPHYKDSLRLGPSAKTNLINAFISSDFDLTGRKAYLRELMKWVHVDSYGKVYNNANLTDDHGPATKLDVISKYKFTIAFENACVEDYVTEKLYEPLIAGSVPIYLGAPNVEDFLPGDECYININSYSSPRALADHLLTLDQDDDKFKKFLRWKDLPYKKKFNDKLSLVEADPIKKLCDVLRDRLIQ